MARRSRNCAFRGEISVLTKLKSAVKTSVIAFQSKKKKLSLQEALDLLQNLPSESNDALTDDSSDEDVPANYLLEFSLNSQETEQDSRGGKKQKFYTSIRFLSRLWELASVAKVFFLIGKESISYVLGSTEFRTESTPATSASVHRLARFQPVGLDKIRNLAQAEALLQFRNPILPVKCFSSRRTFEYGNK
ncbi:hypothetical protein TNCV_2566421 [Trichonephila clavipes]|uniref:Uncharacterized protein n=1 Tax=Trichonephila clavipes TaxID=2585209 RepID=A0A8X7BNL2_TRICX|nr:hypothetical protein TNCV_2566421 [Trichonephila clavipes]